MPIEGNLLSLLRHRHIRGRRRPRTSAACRGFGLACVKFSHLDTNVTDHAPQSVEAPSHIGIRTPSHPLRVTPRSLVTPADARPARARPRTGRPRPSHPGKPQTIARRASVQPRTSTNSPLRSFPHLRYALLGFSSPSPPADDRCASSRTPSGWNGGAGGAPRAPSGRRRWNG